MFFRRIAIMLVIVSASHLCAMDNAQSLIVDPKDVVYFNVADKEYWLPISLIEKAQSPLLTEIMSVSLASAKKKKNKENRHRILLNTSSNVADLIVHFLYNENLPGNCVFQDALKAEKIFQIPALSEYMRDNLIERWYTINWGPTYSSACPVCEFIEPKTDQKFGEMHIAVHHLKTVHNAKIITASDVYEKFINKFGITFQVPVLYKDFLLEQAALAKEEEKKARKLAKKEKKKLKKLQQTNTQEN